MPLSSTSSLALLATIAACAPSLASAAEWTGPRVLLGTGGGGGGFDAPKWLAAGGRGFNLALAYCYAQFTPQCSHVAAANAVTAAGLAPADAFYATKIEPEDFGPVERIWGFVRTVTRDVLQELNTNSVGALMWHQAGRSQGAGNYLPPCVNVSAAGPAGPGAYAECRIEGHRALLAVQKAGGAKLVGASNYAVRDLQQIFDATGVWPDVLEIEVHPFWHEDALIDFAVSKGIFILSYAPLAKGAAFGLLENAAVVAVAAAHGVTPAQAVLKWGLQRTGGAVLPRSTNSSHMAENLACVARSACARATNGRNAPGRSRRLREATRPFYVFHSQGARHDMEPDGGRDGFARQLAAVQALRDELFSVVLKALCSMWNGGRGLVHRHPSRPSRKPLSPLSRTPLAADAAKIRVQAAVPRLDRVVVVNGVLGDVGLHSEGRRRRRKREGSEQRARALT